MARTKKTVKAHDPDLCPECEHELIPAKVVDHSLIEYDLPRIIFVGAVLTECSNPKCDWYQVSLPDPSRDHRVAIANLLLSGVALNPGELEYITAALPRFMEDALSEEELAKLGFLQAPANA